MSRRSKRRIALIGAAIVLLAAIGGSIAYLVQRSQEPVPASSQPLPNLNGTWRDSVSGGYFVVSQTGSTIQVEGFNAEGIPVSAGEGNLSGQQLYLTYRSLDGSTTEAQLAVSPDGQRVEGTWRDDYGQSGDLSWSR